MSVHLNGMQVLMMAEKKAGPERFNPNYESSCTLTMLLVYGKAVRWKSVITVRKESSRSWVMPQFLHRVTKINRDFK